MAPDKSRVSTEALPCGLCYVGGDNLQVILASSFLVAGFYVPLGQRRCRCHISHIHCVIVLSSVTVFSYSPYS